jgi:DNA-binding beta-propeller fold protein YncE
VRKACSCALVVSVLLTILTALPAAAAEARRPVWTSLYRGPHAGLDEPRAIGVSPDGRVVFVSGVHHVVGRFDEVTIAYDADSGRKLWVAAHGGPRPRRVVALAVSPLGDRVFVTSTIYHPASTGRDFHTAAYSARSGKRLWIRQYDGTGPLQGDDEPVAIVSDPSGRRVYVAGTSFEDGVESLTAIAYNAATGHTEWASHLSRDPGNGSSHEPYAAATAAALSPTGPTLYVTGFTTDSFVIHATTVALRTGNGGTRWVSDYTVPDSYFRPSSVAVSPRGDQIYVTGPAGGTDGVPFETVTVAHSADDGSVVWTRARPGMYSRIVASVSPSGGRLVIAGSGPGYEDLSGASLDHWVVVCYGPRGGRRLWERYFGSQAGIASETPYAIAASRATGRVYVAGSIASRGSHDWWAVVAYRVTDGLRLWRGRIVGPWRPSGSGGDAIAASASDGHVFITGASAERASDGPGLDFNFLTAAYRG